MEKSSIIFRLSGKGISPESVNVKELMDLLLAFQSLILEQTKHDYPLLDRDTLFLSLTEIKQGSAVYSFSSTAPAQTYESFLAIRKAIEENDARTLPFKSVEGLKRIHSYVKRNKCRAILGAVSENEEKQTVITSKSTFAVLKGFKGETYLYGTVIRVGGQNPTVSIQTEENMHLTCDVSHKIAKELAKNLYEYVGLKGVAKWVGPDCTIESFRVTELLPFKDKSIKESFADLRKVLGKYYEDIKNPDEYVKGLRSEEGDDL